MRANSFKLNSVYMAMLLATTATVQAEENQNDPAVDDVEVIQVSGIRGSLNKAAAIKRDAFGVVDAISAEDIGKFPDTNLAESLQRITGVSIDRANNEGNQVTVRGFGPSFNLVTLNGRQMPNSSVQESEGVSRSFNFREIASESVSAVNVHKTSKANNASGGIGATIDIETSRPFDFGEFKAFAGVKGIADRSVEEGSSVTPEISGMISNTFRDGAFGILISASHSERDSHRDRVGTDGWVTNRGDERNPDGSLVSKSNRFDYSGIDPAVTGNNKQNHFVPWTAVVEQYETKRKRDNAQVVLQLSPIDSVVATLDYTVSTLEETSTTNRMAYWFDDPTGQTDANGTVFNLEDPNDELNFWAWQYFERKENDSLGLNIEWQVNDGLSLALDIHDSTSHSNPDGQIGTKIANLKNSKIDHDNDPATEALGVDIFADFSGELPVIGFDDSNLPGGAFARNNIVSDLYQEQGFEMKNNIEQVHLSGLWENLDGGALVQVKFGVQQTKFQMDTSENSSFAFVDIPLENLDLRFDDIGDTADQFSGSENIFQTIPRYDVNQFIDIVTEEGLYSAPDISSNGVKEDTIAYYAAADFEFELGDLNITVNTGLRYEETDVISYSFQEGIKDINFRAEQELKVEFDGIFQAQELEGGYSELLPNIDVKVDITDDLVARVSLGKTLSRPSLSALFPSTSFNNVRPFPVPVYNASQGNPNLSPIKSKNIDLSLEWYYDDSSFVSVGYFRKDVDDFIGSLDVQREILNVDGEPLRDPSFNPRPGCPDSSATPNPACLSQPSDPVITWTVSSSENLSSRVIDGVEFNVQHMLGDTGFGGIVNYTLVDTDDEVNVHEVGSQDGLEGLSDSANLVAFYEDDKFQTRLAYNWRDEFLLGFSNGSPNFVESYGQLDLSVSYNIDETFTVFVDALNLTDETTRRFSRFESQLLDAEQYGTRYTFGIRGSW